LIHQFMTDYHMKTRHCGKNRIPGHSTVVAKTTKAKSASPNDEQWDNSNILVSSGE